MAEQLIFDLPANTAFGRENFFMSSANSLAVQAVENWQSWPQNKLVLAGPEGAGKTHLARIWADQVSAQSLLATQIEQNITAVSRPVCVEDIERIGGNNAAEEALFHLHNHAQNSGLPLLLTGRGAVSEWGICLPDLLSRLQASQTVFLLPPDDALLSAVLVKLFADLQLRIEPGLIEYLLPRMERSIAAAQQLVRALDRQGLQHKRAVGVRMARNILDSLQMEND